MSVIVSVFPAVHMAKVFVYGSLKKGQPNHFSMMDHANGQAEFVAHARTVDRYPLVIATKYNVPYLLNVPGTGQHVTGEIYSVDQQMLDYLDWFEKCPQKYQRSRIRLEVQDGPGGGEHTPKAGSADGPGGGEHTPKAGSSLEAFVYSTETYEPEWLQNTTYENYEAYGDHGLHFVRREDRSPE
ncbi:hypothetical protein R3I94_004804 [Phoxinus phoxinus]